MKSILAALALLLIAQGANAAPRFTPFDGKDAQAESPGGDHVTVDGMEIWSNGTPPRRWRTIGYLTDSRQTKRLFGFAHATSLSSDIVQAARANGGDAVILLDVDTKRIGVTAGWALQGAAAIKPDAAADPFGRHAGDPDLDRRFSEPEEVQTSRYAVIKWLDDGAPPPPHRKHHTRPRAKPHR
jgi:hypothetical protein